MPLNFREAFILGLFFFSVPVQYLLTISLQSDTDKTQALGRLLHDLKDLKESWFNIEVYRNQWRNIVAWFSLVLIVEPPPSALYYSTLRHDETPAYDVIRYRQERGYFTMSASPRNSRPRHITYRVGQVVKHRSEGYVGVIIGWDFKAMAPEHWLAREYGDRQALRHFPHYAVLVDEREPITSATISPEAVYVVQQDLVVVSNTQVQHPHIDNFFETYDGAQYIPGNWLKKLYPYD